MKITFIEHACFLLEHGGKTVVIDPFTTDLGKVLSLCPTFLHPDYVLLTHGHDDHTGALTSIVGKNTEVIAIVELASFFRSKGIKCTGINFGGSVKRGEFTFSLVPALHSSSQDGIYLGEAGGFIVKVGNHTVYHAGDTDVFGDMRLIDKFYRPTIGLIPIGGKFTTDEEKAAFACTEYFNFDTVIPMHYGTFPGIEAEPDKFASLLKGGTVAVILSPGQSKDFG